MAAPAATGPSDAFPADLPLSSPGEARDGAAPRHRRLEPFGLAHRRIAAPAAAGRDAAEDSSALAAHGTRRAAGPRVCCIAWRARRPRRSGEPGALSPRPIARRHPQEPAEDPSAAPRNAVFGFAVAGDAGRGVTRGRYESDSNSRTRRYSQGGYVRHHQVAR